MIRICVRCSIVGCARLQLDCNWYDTETGEQGGFPCFFDDVGSSGDVMITEMQSFVSGKLPGSNPGDVVFI